MKYLLQKSRTTYKKSSFITIERVEFNGTDHSAMHSARSAFERLYNSLEIENGFRKRLVEVTGSGVETVLIEEGTGLDV